MVALGLTLIYGVLNQINFAHADFVTVGAFTAFFTATRFATRWLGLPDTGGYLLSLNGQGTCGESRCPNTYHTLVGGIALVAGAAALVGGATWLLVIARRKLRARVAAAPLPRGGLLALAGGF